MKEEVYIRKISIEDLDQLQKIGQQTFRETFAKDNTEENMKAYLDTGFSREKLASELDDKNTEFYFAELSNQIIGYLKLNFGNSQTEIQTENAVEVERIYVLKEHQGKKVGQALFDKAIEIGKQKQADYIWLGVWEKNPKAIRFYEKNGFEAFDKHVFFLGEDEQTDIMMKLSLKD